eukprot:5882896-Pleurochrysis_carterae.AAC.1
MSGNWQSQSVRPSWQDTLCIQKTLDPRTTATGVMRPMMEAATTRTRRQRASPTINPTTVNASSARRSAKRLDRPTRACQRRTRRDSFHLSMYGLILQFATWRRGVRQCASTTTSSTTARPSARRSHRKPPTTTLMLSLRCDE